MFTTRPTLQGTFGMASTTHWLASAAAVAVLEDGGNAYDAGVAAAFVLHVAEPHLNGPAGEVPMIVAPREEEIRVISGQGPAPSQASIRNYRALGLTEIPGSGLLSACVPGAFDAWMLLLRDYGTQSLSQVLRFAIFYAEHGVPVVENISKAIAAVEERFATEWHGSASIYLKSGRPPRPGELLKNVPLAATWRRLLDESQSADRVSQIEKAREIWRRGFIAEAVHESMHTPIRDSTGVCHEGVISKSDLESFEASYEAPAIYDWRGWIVYKPGIWSQGPVFLQQLALLPEDLDYGTVEFYHRLIEGTKLAMADREAWYGDNNPIPVEDLLSEDYSAQRRALIDPAHASPVLRPGSPGGRAPRLPAFDTSVSSADPTLGEPTVSDFSGTRGDTCHIDVVDRWGNMLAATPSGGWLQSNPVIEPLGFPLGTRLQMAWLQEGLPNSLKPGRRPRTTLSPSIAARDGEAVMAFGTPGGDAQDQWSFHFFLAVALRERARGGYDLQGAIDLPNWHSNSFPDSFYPHAMEAGSVTFEDRIGDTIIRELSELGHVTSLGDPWSEGRLCAVSRDPASGILSAGANPRGMQGYAAGR